MSRGRWARLPARLTLCRYGGSPESVSWNRCQRRRRKPEVKKYPAHHPLMRYYKQRIIRRLRLLQLRWPLRENTKPRSQARRREGEQTVRKGGSKEPRPLLSRQAGADADTRSRGLRTVRRGGNSPGPAGRRPSERGAHPPVSEASFLSTNNSS